MLHGSVAMMALLCCQCAKSVWANQQQVQAMLTRTCTHASGHVLMRLAGFWPVSRTKIARTLVHGQHSSAFMAVKP